MTSITVTSPKKSTVELLQQHLDTPVTEYRPGYFHKQQAGTLLCVDGSTMSVQASKEHYSLPRQDKGLYTHVEIWRIFSEKPVTQFEYTDSDPSAYVPIEDVAAFIDSCGGYAGQITKG
jgi:hypothetical protein